MFGVTRYGDPSEGSVAWNGFKHRGNFVDRDIVDGGKGGIGFVGGEHRERLKGAEVTEHYGRLEQMRMSGRRRRFGRFGRFGRSHILGFDVEQMGKMLGGETVGVDKME